MPFRAPFARRLALAALTLAALAVPAFGWGRSGHALINKLAVDALPEGPLKVYFKENRDYIAEHSIDPDEAKHADRSESRKHYLDICTDGIDPKNYPRTWKAAVARFGEDAATKQGKLPWAMQEKFEELVQALKAKDGEKIVERATWLGHYVGDGHQPFHACSNNNGQLTGQKGIHSIFETGMIDRNLGEIEPAVSKLLAKMQVAEVKGEISDWCFERLTSGDKLAHEILEKDKAEHAGGREKHLFETTGEIAERRLAEAASGLASLWLTAWIRAGKPALPGEKIAARPDPPKADPPKQPDPPPQPPVPMKPQPGVGGGSDRGDEDPGVAPPRKDPPPKPPEPPKEPKPEPPKEPEPPPSKNAVEGGIKGLMVHDDDNQPGAIVDVPGDACSSGGILRRDVIITIDGNHVNSVSTLKARLKDYKAGDAVPIGVLRKGVEELHTVRIP